MLLEPLTDALALVRDRINNFEQEFTTNEQQTRLSLVDPVLKALEWDPEDPTTVKVEYAVRQRNRNNIRVDYALLASRFEPVAFVEAKKLGTDLGPAHHQLFEYAVGESVPYVIATNGAIWAIYKRERQGANLLFKHLLEVSITNQPLPLAAIKLLSLWKGLLTSQSSIDQIAPALNELKAESKPVPVVPPSVEDESFDLNNPPMVSHRKPTSLLLPDGTRKQISNWSSVLIETAKWLLANNKLTVNMPWKANPNSTRNILQQSEICNRHGMRIKQQVQIDSNIYLLINFDSKSICNVTAKLLDDCRIQNSKVKVTLARHSG